MVVTSAKDHFQSFCSRNRFLWRTKRTIVLIKNCFLLCSEVPMHYLWQGLHKTYNKHIKFVKIEGPWQSICSEKLSNISDVFHAFISFLVLKKDTFYHLLHLLTFASSHARKQCGFLKVLFIFSGNQNKYELIWRRNENYFAFIF